MIIFNECKIDDEGKNLIVDVEVEDSPYFEDVYPGVIYIDTEDTFVCDSKPSDTHVFKESLQESRKPNRPAPVKKKRVSITIPVSSLLFTSSDNKIQSYKDHIFFIYIEVEGEPSIDCPCGLDIQYTPAVIVDMNTIYRQALNYIKELGDSCSIPKGLIDIILRIKALELSIKTKNYISAASLYKKLFKSNKLIAKSTDCGCSRI